MGLYPGDPGPPGADCGATVLGLGDSVKHLKLADDVFGESPGCGLARDGAVIGDITGDLTWDFSGILQGFHGS